MSARLAVLGLNDSAALLGDLFAEESSKVERTGSYR